MICGLAFAASSSAQAPAYAIEHTFNIGGEGRWDYVIPDPPRHRLFIARTDRVSVIDERSGRVVGEVTGIDGAHGTAIVERWGHGFATSGNDGRIIMFDLKTFKSLGSTPAARDADSIVYDSASDRIFSFNGDAHSSTVVNPRDGTLVVNLPLGGKPEYGATAGNGKVYVNITDTSEIVEIDSRTQTVTRRWSTEPCKQPVSMAIDTKSHRLFSGCRSGVLAVSDYGVGKVIATVPIGMGVDGTAYDTASRNIFAANADGTMTVIHQDSADQYRVLQSVPTVQGSRNLGLDLRTHQVFLPAAEFGPATEDARRPPMVPGSFRLLVVEAKPRK
jgi:DNA-binding beta-propeller fold protein YncE